MTVKENDQEQGNEYEIEQKTYGSAWRSLDRGQNLSRSNVKVVIIIFPVLN